MTSATFSRTSTPAGHRTPTLGRSTRVLAVAALAGMLTLTGCGGDGDSGPKDGGHTADGSPTASADPTGGTDGGVKAGDLEGSWVTTADGRVVALVVTGKQVALFATGGNVCSGSVTADSGQRTVRMTCTDGSKDRATGTIDSVSADSLKVTWESAKGTEKYVKAKGGKLPSGLPTANLGS